MNDLYRHSLQSLPISPLAIQYILFPPCINKGQITNNGNIYMSLETLILSKYRISAKDKMRCKSLFTLLLLQISPNIYSGFLYVSDCNELRHEKFIELQTCNQVI